jgi:chemotaxis protein MotB
MRRSRRLPGAKGSHTEDWLITYADTITLLLCLFVIILSVRSSGAVDAAKPIVPAVTNDVFGGNPPFHAMACNANPAVGAIVETPPEPIVETGLPRPLATVNIPKPDVATPAAAPVSLPGIVDRLKSQGTAVVEQQGDRITTLQIGSTAFFNSGNATISGAGKSILSDVAGTLKSDAFAAYHISIEGHTDDMPISTPQFQSNWELSTARAAAVVRFFLEQGIPAEKLTAAGYADTFPIVPNRNADGTVIPDNQARNRRVVIRLEKIDKAER